ncbi:syntaxin-8 isoform X1 [Mycteria americana]|uniref:syntaxin-8 isoform X1 n=1 Tax=Mycteria americana TaxID=33587 RepID=UPI003F583D2F
MAPDPWLSLYDATCQITQEIAEKIQERNRYQRNGESSAKLNVIIRSSLQNLREKIDQLKDLLLRAVSTHQITQLEGDRRQNLVDDLLTRQKQLQASYKNEGTEPDVIRSSLMTGGVKRGVTNPWLLEESEETRGLGFDDLRQQQRRIIEEQDAGLDALSSIISRQKQMGQEIGNELDEQNDQSRFGEAAVGSVGLVPCSTWPPSLSHPGLQPALFAPGMLCPFVDAAKTEAASTKGSFPFNETLSTMCFLLMTSKASTRRSLLSLFSIRK